MIELEKKVLNTIKEYNLIETGDKVVVGVSGGPDSICLLNVLNNLKKDFKIDIFVAHINHMIREEADIETEYVQEFCEKIGVECFTKRVNVIKLSEESKLGTEETGRKIRYDFFREVKQKTNSNKIATAHNLNDNAETVLMNIIRGSGSSGLKGIEPIKNDLIRPIIKCRRDEIENYCEILNLDPKFDKSNRENIYTRNKIRNLLIPYLKENFNPNIIETINRMSDLLKQENDYFEEVTRQEYTKLLLECDETKIVLELKLFNLQKKVIKSKIILYTINNLLGSSQGIEKVNIEDIIKLCENNIGNKYLIPNKNIKILVKNKKIFFIKNA
ncbi:MAG: tRNA lysidine(34) synthetase TilS [Clostridia bacterium]|nr:tRNA lysidine(34) synthetase TilS [Clostridia bacterium]